MIKNCSITEATQLTPEQDALARDVLENLSGKWSFWILDVLGTAEQPMRFARLLEAVEGISQKVLTRTLRHLEQDGFVSRQIYAEVPPRVEYALTDLGRELLVEITPLLAWVVRKVDLFGAAREKAALSAQSHRVD
ncbi:winged helix-turn-helix transcriptional regulator [Gluconobacter kondonii]|uniref:winged helix-turn-helix transcriptional regulator n=1 Tax=Gluconobacter kondonii TaxID=941463 RepID=UPI001B8CFADC|nr:helix-turn-helix domain-containing protein [Gluconobacter kondonii]MBS1081256.1 helix-turn-helix transcriptional regulator [Gluconobacter kondonii]